MVQQVFNSKQVIADLLFKNWNLKNPDAIKKENISFNGFSSHPDTRFQDGNKIVIEIDNPVGTGEARTLANTKILDYPRLDIWIKMEDTSRESRIRYENYRALIKDEIMRIIDINKKAIQGFKLSTFSRFIEGIDELENLILRSAIILKAEWYHKAE